MTMLSFEAPDKRGIGVGEGCQTLDMSHVVVPTNSERIVPNALPSEHIASITR